MEELSSSKLLCKRQASQFSLSSVQTKLTLRLTLRRQVSWLGLDACLLTLCGVQWLHSQMLQSDVSVLKRESSVTIFSIGKNKYSIPVILQAIQQTGAFSRRFWVIAALNWCFLERLRFFPTFFSNVLDTVEIEMFFFCASLVIFWHGSFSKAFLMASWLITWGRPDRRPFFRRFEVFKRCSTRWTVFLLTFNCFEFLDFVKPPPKQSGNFNSFSFHQAILDDVLISRLGCMGLKLLQNCY